VITLTGQTPISDVYRIDGGSYQDIPQYVSVVGIWDGMPPALLAACRDRRSATLIGYCSTCPYTDRRHSPACHAGRQVLAAALDRWARTTPGYARGRRLAETPERPAEATTPHMCGWNCICFADGCLCEQCTHMRLMPAGQSGRPRKDAQPWWV
jgi:hypothetical protein